MCNRYRISASRAERYPDAYRRQCEEEALAIPKAVICPTDIGIFLALGKSGDVKAVQGRWGFWRDFSNAVNNARAENLTSAMWSAARRCVVPMDEYYEWDTGKRMWTIRDDGGEPLWVAGLWERFKDPHGDPSVLSYTIVTKPPLPQISRVHDRMPVCLRGWEECASWLSGERQPFDPSDFRPDAVPEIADLFEA